MRKNSPFRCQKSKNTPHPPRRRLDSRAFGASILPFVQWQIVLILGPVYHPPTTICVMYIGLDDSWLVALHYYILYIGLPLFRFGITEHWSLNGGWCVSFSIVIFIMWTFSANKHMDGSMDRWMDGWMDGHLIIVCQRWCRIFDCILAVSNQRLYLINKLKHSGLDEKGFDNMAIVVLRVS